MLTVGTEAGRHPLDYGTVEDRDRGIAQQRQDRWSLPDMDQAGIFTERHVFAPVEPILDRPMATAQRQQPCGGDQPPAAGW